MPRLAGLVAALALLTPLAACGNSGGEVAQDDLSPAAVIRQAASQSGASSFRFVMDVQQGENTMRGSGEYQGGATPALRQVMEMPGLGSSEFLVIGRQSWMKFSVDGGSGAGMGLLFPAGKWIAADADEEFGMSADELDFRSFLQSLFAAADVREVGEEDVDGLSTRHYVGTVTAAAVRASTEIDEDIKKALAEELAAAEGDKAEIEAWIDRDFQVRKFAQRGTDSDGDYRMTMTLSGFGDPLNIVPPAKKDVADERGMAKLMEKQAREAAQKVRAKYGSEAELKKACRKLERDFASSSDGGAMPETPPDQNLMMACTSVLMSSPDSF